MLPRIPIMLASLLAFIGVAGTQLGCSTTRNRACARPNACDTIPNTPYGHSFVAGSSEPFPVASVTSAQNLLTDFDTEPLYRGVPSVQWPGKESEPAKLVSTRLRNAPARSEASSHHGGESVRFTLGDLWNKPTSSRLVAIRNRYRPGQTRSGVTDLEPRRLQTGVDPLRITDPVPMAARPPLEGETVLPASSISIVEPTNYALKILPVASEVSFAISESLEPNSANLIPTEELANITGSEEEATSR